MTEKPLLLIDVDGPLNPWFAKVTRRPDQYQTHRFPLRGCSRKHPLRVWLNPQHGDWLLELAEVFELTWCTQWQDEANRWISPVLGLPEDLPWIPFPGNSEKGWIARGWKYPAIAEYAKGRHLAWIDDSFEKRFLLFDVAPWDRHEAVVGIGSAVFEFLAKRQGLRTLLHQVSPKEGLTIYDVDALKGWASTVTP